MGWTNAQEVNCQEDMSVIGHTGIGQTKVEAEQLTSRRGEREREKCI